MVLYTSLVLILLTFFIMISAKANFDETKYGKVVESVTQTFGPFRGGRTAIGEDAGLDLESPSLGERAGSRVADPQMAGIRSLLAPGILDGRARIVHNKGQRIISLSSEILFLPDSAELTPEAAELLLAFARIMRDSDIEIAVEGHTDNLPPQTEGVEDNWDLSVDRALSVLFLLQGEGGVAAERLSAYGYGGEKPAVSNNSPANRAKNNRVDLVLDFDSTRAGALKGLTEEDRSFDFQGFEFSLPEKPGEESEVY
jgi:chemotaxis protein MotB